MISILIHIMIDKQRIAVIDLVRKSTLYHEHILCFSLLQTIFLYIFVLKCFL
ncbi:unnamed protein product [Schistosoma margrebowiei]|uniref:Uncharacterized protein n=1 Tax=Schistosoma margrebowiei TaxID=48269 RepID=A0A183MCD9_9TREM|nr:unnamed protein product [Schistosoma margrebowiei]